MFVIDVPYLNLNKTYDSLQVPRWQKLRDDKYVVIYKDKALKVEQKKDRLIMNCSEEEFFEIWFEYFDLKNDYLDLLLKVRRLGGKMKIAANRGKGIHLIKHEPFEAYIQSKLVQYVGHENMGWMINHIASTCGVKHQQAMREAGRVTWFEFPTPEMILENENRLVLPEKVKAWLHKACSAIVYDSYDIAENGNDMFKMLCNNDLSVFPMYDVDSVIERNFKCEPWEFEELFLGSLKEKGIAYIYILNHIFNRPKEMK